MDWNGSNRTHVGAGYAPLGRIIGMAAYGFDIEAAIDGREARRLIRSLKHRRLVCFRRQKATLAAAKVFARQLNSVEIGGVLLAPANLDDRAEVSFVDSALHRRLGGARPEFTYRHDWRAGDVLVWTKRLAMT